MKNTFYLPSFSLVLFFVFNAQFSSAQSIISTEILEELSQNELTLLTSVNALNGVIVYKVNYLTNGSDNQPDTASGLVVLPDDTTVVRLLAYQHGTTDGREDVPSRNNNEALLAKALAGQGYIVSAADYLGLGDSRGFHPYVHAATEASAGVDLLLASRDLASMRGFSAVEQIFVTGYSQGGHAAMAMAQAIQERSTDDLFITAAAPMSGPYSISSVMKDVTLLDTSEYFFPAYAAYTLLGYQEVYGNLYDSLEQVFKPQFIPMINAFYEGNIGLGNLNVFLIDQLTTDFGGSIPVNLFNDQFLDSFINDSLNSVNIALADNDTYLWVPQFPMRLFYCTGDDQVNFMNSLVAEEYMKNNGAADIQAIDVFPPGDHGECVFPAVLATLAFFNEFPVSTSTVERSTWSDLEVFPNPVTDQLTLKAPDLSNGQLRIYNQLGISVLSIKNFNGSALNVSNLPPGIYHLILSGKGEIWRGQFIIQR